MFDKVSGLRLRTWRHWGDTDVGSLSSHFSRTFWHDMDFLTDLPALHKEVH